MAKFNILKALGFNSSSKSIFNPFSGRSVTNMFSSMSNIFTKNTDFLSEYKNWVYACVTTRATDVGNIQLKLFSGDKEIFTSPLLDLLKKVNPTMTKHDLFNNTQTYLDLDGNAFWFLAREENAGREIKEIYLLRPDRVSVVSDKENPIQIAGYVYKAQDGGKITFEADEIIHFKNFNPQAMYPYPAKGMGIVEAAYFSIHTDNKMREFNSAFFKNSARPDGMLIPDGDSAMAPEEYDRLKEEWNEEHQGSANAHKIAVLQGGLKWQEIGRSQNDMQYLEQMRFNRDEILSLFRVPKSLIGISEDVNRANAEAAIYVYSLKTIKPLMQSIVDTLNEFLVPYFKDKGLYLDFVSPVTEDKAEQRADFTAGIDKWYSRNEIREILGLAPTVGGDNFMGTLNQIQIDNTTPIKRKKELEKPIEKNVSDLVNSFVAKLPESKHKGLKKIEGTAKSAYIQTWKNHLDVLEGPLKKKLVSYFEEQKSEVMKNLNSEYKGLEAKEFKVKGISNIVFDYDDSIGLGISLITPFIREYIEKSGEQGTVLASGEKFDLDTPRIKDFIPKRAEYFAKSINDTTTNKLLFSIQEGIDNTETLEEISKRVADIYDIAVGSRTQMIARTEVAASSNFGAVEAYKQAGVEQHQWIVVNPEDHDCIVNEGEVVKIGSPFNDGSTEAPVHPNCFLHHTIKIQTDNGIKTINKIKVGDNVLTHRGRYKKVTKVLEKTERYKGDAVQITYKGRSKKYRNSFTVTPEHPFLTVKGWVMAKDLTTFDDLYVLANRCSACNSKIPHWKTFCSASCVVTDEIKQKIGLKNMGENNGMYNRIGSSSPNYKGGKVSYRGSHWRVERRKALVRDNYTCQDCGISEDHNKDLYKGQGLQVHHISPYRETKCNEVDNLTSLCHKCHGVREGTLNKKVLMSGGAEFILMPIREVEHIKNYNGERLYNFAVEEDESYIANGVVHPNCQCTTIPVFED